MKGLSECKASESNVKRIQVKDIVKEVKDHLKTYSSAKMDISCVEYFEKFLKDAALSRLRKDNFQELDYRRKCDAAERAYKAKREKELGMLQCRELSFLMTDLSLVASQQK
ncbi:hypothetical protein Tco_1508739 [Tanacetum coccineum]